MIKHTIITVLLLVAYCHNMCAQEITDTEQSTHQWENIIGSVIEEDGEEDPDNWEALYDALNELENNPVDINTATKEDMEHIPFLTDTEISDILEYIYRNGPILTHAELAMIRSLSAAKIKLLTFFITTNDKRTKGFPKLGNILKYGKHELMVTGGIPLYNRKGDNNGYLGYKYKHNIRYDFTYGNYLRIGIVGSQDSGEPFFANRNNWGYDFYSYYATIKDLGRIKNLTLGKYRIRMGMGLIMNNDLAYGKSMILTSMSRQGTSIRPHSSRSSYNCMQGAASTIALSNNFSITAFASYKDFDATLNNKDGSITTIIESGYHRTETEMKKKGNSTQSVYGGNLQFASNGFHFGLSGYFATLNRTLKPNTTQAYRRYYANGDKFHNASIDYGYSSGKFSFQGETATGNSKAIATINMLNYKLSSNFLITTIQRFYSYKYYSLFSQSFSDGGSVQNESGIYIGINWQPIRKIQITYYSDIAYFPWAKYQASTASHSYDNMFSIIYSPSNWSFLMRYRLKLKEKDNATKSALIYQTTHRAKLITAYSAESWNVKMQLDMTANKYKDSSFGYMASLSSGYTAIKRMKIYANIGYFHTKDYNSRVYSYERGMLYDFSFPAYFGKGIRYSALTNFKMSAKLSATAKAAVTKYFNRKPIGSGLQQVDKSSLCDISMQIKWII